MKHKYQAYTVATQTMPKTKQIVMLYDGTIRFIQQAKEAIREKRIEDRYKALTKATEIISGLQSCLDFENGGDVARTLYSFYSMIENRILAIHRSNSTEGCEEAIAELKKMRDVWHEIDQSTAGSEPVAAPAPLQTAAPTPADPDKNVTLSA